MPRDAPAEPAPGERAGPRFVRGLSPVRPRDPRRRHRGLPMRRTRIALVLALVPERPAGADPYRLRADALAAVEPPAGLVVLEGQGKPRSWASAEAVVWAGAGDGPGDALVALIALRDPGGRGDLRLGRMVLTTGAVRPVQMDGGVARARLPSGAGLEL